MFVNSQIQSSTTDIASFFSDDFFSSSIIYALPNISTESFIMSYLAREDLIAASHYQISTMFGLILLSVGATVEKEGDSVKTVEGFEPLTEIQLKDLTEVLGSQKVTVEANTLTSRDISTERRPDVKVYKYNSSRKFTSTD